MKKFLLVTFLAIMTGCTSLPEVKQGTIEDKVDSTGTVASFDDNIISILEPEGYPLIEKMKTGKILKVSIEKYNGDTILLKFDLKDFNKYLNILNENSK